MTDDELHLLAGAFALDALEPEEAAAFEAHLPTCRSCTVAVAEFEQTAGELGEITHRRPPASMRDRILADIAATPQEAPTAPAAPVAPAAPSVTTPGERLDELAARRRPPVRILAAVAAVAFVVVGVVATFARQGTSTIDELIAAPDAITLQLDPTTDALAEASLEVVWSPEQDRALVRAVGLPDPGEGKVYELWFLVDEGVAPAGLFSPEDGTVEVLIEVDDIDGGGWGVTIEPEAGSEQPTTDVLFAGVV